ncbi:hypothetical protein AB0K21_21905 [Streptosporangium sp. NPDC049248]|uniref:hypothetical protein n=1 Tax=Streptosporangium sp. NPDC049248 TaxID=3155651 RepID=UPI0034220687
MIDSLRATFHTPLIDLDGEGDFLSLRDLALTSRAIHPDWTAESILTWLDEEGHINYLAAEGHLPADSSTELLALITDVIR